MQSPTRTTLQPDEPLAGHDDEAIAALLSATPERTFVITRRYDAPRALVWKAWTDPAYIPHWWGPHGTTYQVEQMDLRSGGRWRFVQVEPPGPRHAFFGVYHEVQPPARLAHTFEFNGAPGDVALEVITFDDVEGATLVTDTMLFHTAAARDAMVDTGMEGGATETFDRLGEVIESLAAERSTAARELVITRTLPFAPALVWQAFTDPVHIDRWWGPTGFRNTTHAIDIRPGGLWRFTMHGPDGTDYPNAIRYEQLDAPRRLVYRHGSDEAELDTDPAAFRSTVTMVEVAGGTQLTMRMLFNTVEALQAVLHDHGAFEGAHQTVDRLAAHLASL